MRGPGAAITKKLRRGEIISKKTTRVVESRRPRSNPGGGHVRKEKHRSREMGKLESARYFPAHLHLKSARPKWKILDNVTLNKTKSREAATEPATSDTMQE